MEQTRGSHVYSMLHISVRANGRYAMSDFTDKIKGTANEAIGKAKVAVGNSMDNPKMVAKGAAQEIKGKAQQVIGAVKSELDKKK